MSEHTVYSSQRTTFTPPPPHKIVSARRLVVAQSTGASGRWCDHNSNHVYVIGCFYPFSDSGVVSLESVSVCLFSVRTSIPCNYIHFLHFNISELQLTGQTLLCIKWNTYTSFGDTCENQTQVRKPQSALHSPRNIHLFSHGPWKIPFTSLTQGKMTSTELEAFTICH